MIPLKHFYMIRHGETEANAARIMAGSLDSPLTENGRRQAKTAQVIVNSLAVKPSVIIHSNLSRARETAQIINEEVVAEAQAEINAMEGEFVVWARDDIAQLEEAYAALFAKHDDNKAHYKMLSTAYAIKSQAGIFGYDLGTEVAGMLVSYLTQHSVIDNKNLLVIRKHIDTINAIFSQKLKDAGHDIAKEFVLSLMQLIEKLG